jgi:hypothetical protein
LLKIFELGYWDHIQIKHIARFLVITPDQPSPKIEISTFDKVGAWSGLCVGIVTIIAGGAIWIGVTLEGKSFYAYLAGLILFCAFTMAAVLFSSGYRRYKNALSFQTFLGAYPDIFSKSSPPEASAPLRAQKEDSSGFTNPALAHNHVAEVTE